MTSTFDQSLPRIRCADRLAFEASCLCITVAFFHRLPMRALFGPLEWLGFVTSEIKSRAFYIADLITYPIHGSMSLLAAKIRDSVGGDDFLQLLHAWRARDWLDREAVCGEDWASIFRHSGFRYHATRAGPYLEHALGKDLHQLYLAVKKEKG